MPVKRNETNLDHTYSLISKEQNFEDFKCVEDMEFISTTNESECLISSTINSTDKKTHGNKETDDPLELSVINCLNSVQPDEKLADSDEYKINEVLKQNPVIEENSETVDYNTLNVICSPPAASNTNAPEKPPTQIVKCSPSPAAYTHPAEKPATQDVICSPPPASHTNSPEKPPTQNVICSPPPASHTNSPENPPTQNVICSPPPASHTNSPEKPLTQNVICSSPPAPHTNSPEEPPIHIIKDKTRYLNKLLKKAVEAPDEFADCDYDLKEKDIKNSHRNKIAKLSYKCKFCVYDPDLVKEESQISYSSNEALREHVLTQHDTELPYSCVICKKNFIKYSTCRRHVFYGHIKPTVVCETCGEEIKANKISQHIMRYHTTGDYKCEICQKEFKNTSLPKFKYHQRWHDTTMQHKCDICDRVFIQIAHLQVHKMDKHTKDFKIKCPNCGEGFSSQYKKSLHMTKMHGDIIPLKCKFCEARFKCYEKRRRHMAAFHDCDTKTEMVKCPTCKKMFRSPLGLKYHQKNGCKGKLDIEDGTEEKQFPCSICPRKFKSKRSMSKHFKFHSMEGRPYSCEACYLNFKTKFQSVNHKCIQLGCYLSS